MDRNLFRVIFITAFFFLENSINSQENIDKNYLRTSNDLFCGYERSFAINNVVIGYKYGIKKSKIIFGLRYHFNDRISDNRNFAFWRRVYAVNFRESLGIAIGIQKEFKHKLDAIIPYWFYLSQLNYISLRVETGYLDSNDVFVITAIQIAPPRLYWENEFGLGLQIKIKNNIYLEQAVAIGYTDINPLHLNLKRFPDDLDPSCYFRIGLNYRISGKKKSSS